VGEVPQRKQGLQEVLLQRWYRLLQEWPGFGVPEGLIQVRFFLQGGCSSDPQLLGWGFLFATTIKDRQAVFDFFRDIILFP
jgi:hypothetical protein